MKITLEILESLSACSIGKKKFAFVFPEGMEVTDENLQKAQEKRLDIDWFAGGFFPGFDSWDQREFELYINKRDKASLRASNTEVYLRAKKRLEATYARRTRVKLLKLAEKYDKKTAKKA